MASFADDAAQAPILMRVGRPAATRRRQSDDVHDTPREFDHPSEVSIGSVNIHRCSNICAALDFDGSSTSEGAMGTQCIASKGFARIDTAGGRNLRVPV